MAALRRVVASKNLLKPIYTLNRALSTSKAVKAEWNYDWCIGPAPKTEAERIAAAEKYGLLPEDYTPYSDGNLGHGDYPTLPWVGEYAKDPHHNWDDPATKRDFHDPVPVDLEVHMADRGQGDRQYRDSPRKMFAYLFGGTLLFMGGMMLTLPYSMLSEQYQHWFPYEMEGEYVFQGPDRNYRPGGPLPSYKKNAHYTFEPAQ
ncbi:NADH dehydrogenase 1 beta subcomplex subunit 8 ndufb8 [Mactra antiquata]